MNRGDRVGGDDGVNSQRAVRLFVHSFLIALGYMITRTLGDGLLLSRLGSDALSTVMLISLPVVSMISLAWSRMVSAGVLVHGIAATRIGLAALSCGISLLLSTHREAWIPVVMLYLCAEIRGVLNTTQMATLLNEMVPAQDTRGLSLAFAGAPVAGITSGILIGVHLGGLTPPQLLLLAAACDVLALIPILGLERIADQSPGVPVSLPSRRTIDRVRIRRLGRRLMTMIVLQVLVLAFVGYEWRLATGHLFQTEENLLTAYFARFYAGCDVITVLLQVTFASTMIQRAGLRSTLLLLPGLLAVTLPVALITNEVGALFAVFTVARATDVIRRGLYDQSLVMLYQPLPLMARRKLIATVNGIAKPAAEWLAVLTIFLISMSGTQEVKFNLIAVPMTALWVWAVWVAFAEFRACEAGHPVVDR
ncbi:MAG: hypothetical protein KDA96_08430 [Planctomycetaceae bacterium]|nr:hypothetical protein [Planctomycetaceae bacterium]